MKQSKLLALMAAFALVSCASEDVLNETNDKTGAGSDVISLNYRLPNQTRAQGTTEKGLQDEHLDFGVWAVKVNSDNDLKSLDLENSENVVMPNYLVGYYEEGVGGYDATKAGATTTNESNWFYEGLGKSYNTAGAATPYITTSKSVNDDQWLKYWDKSTTSTYFWAYAPYFAEDDDPDLSFDANGVPTIQFQQTLTAGTTDTHKLMYAKKNVANANYGNEVELNFQRLISEVKFAFWEDIPGYTVTLESISYGGNTYGVWAIPAVQGAYDATAKKHSYSEGHFVSEGKPAVTLALADGDADDIAYTAAKSSSDMLNFALPVDDDDNEIQIGNDSRPDMVYSPTVYKVLPTSDVALDSDDATFESTNSGFQVVVNYRLEAEDTNEVIHVKNARVYVAPEYTVWKPNWEYTYIFRITKNSTGNTDGTDPTPDPVDPDPALYPIIFDNLKVVETTTDFGKEWLINPKNPTDTNPVNQD